MFNCFTFCELISIYIMLLLSLFTCHFATVNVYPAIVVRVSYGSCPCDNYFVRLR